MKHHHAILGFLLITISQILPIPRAESGELDHRALLESQTFWDNRDWSWFERNIPFFDCPDRDIVTTYYYRWELLTKHLTYGSPNTGYVFTEFIDRPFWSGTYGAISCPAGHQLAEARWLRNPRYARDYLRYWFRTPGAQPRNYSTWLADAAWTLHQVHPSPAMLVELLPDFLRNHEEWEKRHFNPQVGLFWQTGHDDGMEFNIASRQTRDILRGAPSYRPSFNSYMWADQRAIARIARLADQDALARRFDAKADSLRKTMIDRLWDPKREFFFPMFRDDEERDGHRVRALTRTYESGRYAGDPHGRELIGYVPWQFGMLDDDARFDVAWRKLTDRDGFFATFGPTTVERNDPMFLLRDSCCWWSGQSWPYATTQTLQGLARLLQRGPNPHISRADYVDALQRYARSHRKDGKPYLAEALHPDTGSFEGHDARGHSEHYFHSAFCDLVITGLVGITPRDDEILELRPLAPEDWAYFALDDLSYKGRSISVLWDAVGNRYGRGRGLHVVVDGRLAASTHELGPLRIELPPAVERPGDRPLDLVATNFAVNNDGDYHPRIEASHTAPGTSPAALIDGNTWYHRTPANRWTTEGSPNPTDEIILELGAPRLVHTLALAFLDDGIGVVPPASYRLEAIRGGRRFRIEHQENEPARPTGRRVNSVRFPEQPLERIAVVFEHAPGGRTGLSEIELWGDAKLPVAAAPPPAGNLARRAASATNAFPRIRASHTSRFDRIESVNDGRVVFAANPNNRWTSYESPTEFDHLEVEFGEPTEFRRIDLAIYDDRGGVQAPRSYRCEWWDGSTWRAVETPTFDPREPAGGRWNSVRFQPVTAVKVRVVFEHRSPARSGLSELMIWND
ncbi:MAG: discoidin domain-containing protein [Isosphaeraceae bacterium]|nr:discoidin domain-containing protein [Isosphaeraceae bacterium]